MKNKNNDTRISIFIGIVITFLTLTLLYSVFSYKDSERLVSMRRNDFDIYIEEVSASSVGEASYELPNVNKTSLDNFKVVLNNTKDTVTFSFNTVNKGKSSVELIDIVKSKPLCSDINLQKYCDSINYSLTYEDGREVKIGDDLKPNSVVEMKLLINSLDNNLSFLKNGLEVYNLGINLVYNHN